MIAVKAFTFNPFAENTYLLYNNSKAGIIIDPGCYEAEEQQSLKAYIEQEGIQIEKVVNTHCHIDHVLGNDYCCRTFEAPLLLPEAELPLLQAVPAFAGNYGFPQYQERAPEQFIEAGEPLRFGDSELQVLSVPGHSPGHLAFYASEDGFCIGGDALFQGSIGRTDLPGGNFDQLIKSIQTELFALPDETTVYCGHGPSTTIGQEKRTNPFCAIQG